MSKSALVRVYDSYDEAAKAVDLLLENGIFKKYISVMAKGEQEEKNEFEFSKQDNDIIFWGEQGAFWGSLWGLLSGGVLFWVPGFGPLVATGRILAAVAGMIGGAALFGAGGAMTAWFVDLGIEKTLAHKYGELLEENKILLIVHGDDAIVAEAEKVLGSSAAV